MDDDLYLMANIPIHQPIQQPSQQHQRHRESQQRDKTMKRLRKTHGSTLVKLLKKYLKTGHTELYEFDTQLDDILVWIDKNEDEIKRTL